MLDIQLFIGSTIVLVFEAPDNLVFNFKSGEPIRLGQPLCTLNTEQNIRLSNLVEANESSCVSTEDSDSDMEEEETKNFDQSELSDSIFLDAMAFDATIADADVINNQHGSMKTRHDNVNLISSDNSIDSI